MNGILEHDCLNRIIPLLVLVLYTTTLLFVRIPGIRDYSRVIVHLSVHYDSSNAKVDLALHYLINDTRAHLAIPAACPIHIEDVRYKARGNELQFLLLVLRPPCKNGNQTCRTKTQRHRTKTTTAGAIISTPSMCWRHMRTGG